MYTYHIKSWVARNILCKYETKVNEVKGQLLV